VADRITRQRGTPPAGVSPDDVRGRIVLRLRDLADAISDLQGDFARTVGLHTTDLDAVTHLSDGPMSMGTLGRRLSLSPGAVTGLVDRLERIGHVRRTPSPVDRRQTILELNPAAQRVIDEYFGDLARRLLDLLEPFSDEELAAIERFLDGLPERLAAGPSPHDPEAAAPSE